MIDRPQKIISLLIFLVIIITALLLSCSAQKEVVEHNRFDKLFQEADSVFTYQFLDNG